MKLTALTDTNREGVLVQAIQEGMDALNRYADADERAGSVVYGRPHSEVHQTIIRMATARNGFELDAYLDERKDHELKSAREHIRVMKIALQQIAYSAGHISPEENPHLALQLIRSQAQDALEEADS